MANAGGTNQAPARQLAPTHQSEAVRAAAAAVKDAASSEPPRPIVRNRRIERVDPPAWDAAALPFDYLVRMSQRDSMLATMQSLAMQGIEWHFVLMHDPRIWPGA